MPTLQDAIFSLKTFAAAMLALYVAFSLDLPRPYWAMLTVYIVAQPLSGMARSKGVYRAAGTLTGAAFAVLAVPNLVTGPELLCLAFAGWLALCLYLSLLDGTPRAYAFMLAGYTAAIIGFPSVAAPEGIFDTALARSEEILLGILCATLVDMLVLPRPVGPIFRARLDAWLADAARWTRDVLAGEGEARGDADRHRLVADAAALGTLRLHAAYDTPALRAAEGWLVQLERWMRMLVSVLLAVEDRLAVLRRGDPAALERLRPVLDRLGASVSASGNLENAQAVARELRALRPPREAMARDWDALILASLLARLHDLAILWHECRELRRKVAAGERGSVRDESPAQHRDRTMAALSATAAAVATLLACAFWIGSAWPDGGTAATMAAVLSCLFAATDDPAPFALIFLWCTVASAIIAGIYLLGIMPAIDGFPCWPPRWPASSCRSPRCCPSRRCSPTPCRSPSTPPPSWRSRAPTGSTSPPT